MKTHSSHKKYLWAALLAALAAPFAAYACSCVPPPPPKDARDQATAVFSGKATKVETADVQKKVTLQVDRVWKGEVTETATATTCSSDACCGFNFVEGQSYLIYAYKGANDTAFRVSLCSRTAALANATEDIKELGKAEAPKKNPK